MAAFHEVLFPLDISLKSSGGPERRTEIVALGFNTPTENLHYPEPPALRVHHHLIMAQSMAFQNATWLVETAKS